MPYYGFHAIIVHQTEGSPFRGSIVDGQRVYLVCCIISHLYPAPSPRHYAARPPGVDRCLGTRSWGIACWENWGGTCPGRLSIGCLVTPEHAVSVDRTRGRNTYKY